MRLHDSRTQEQAQRERWAQVRAHADRAHARELSTQLAEAALLWVRAPVTEDESSTADAWLSILG